MATARSSDGWRVTVLPVNASGLVDLDAVADGDHGAHGARERDGGEQRDRRVAADQGSWRPSRTRRARGFTPTRCRPSGKVPFDVEALDVDFASMTAHKIYGPKGVGALYVRPPTPRLRQASGVKIVAQIDGGGHERGMRSGTLNVPGIVGFGRAAEIARAEMASEAKRVAALRDRLLDRLAGEDGRDDGERRRWTARLPGNLNVSFAGDRRRSAAGESRRHGGVVGCGVHAGGTVACADGAGVVERSGAGIVAVRHRAFDDHGGRGVRGEESERGGRTAPPDVDRVKARLRTVAYGCEGCVGKHD